MNETINLTPEARKEQWLESLDPITRKEVERYMMIKSTFYNLKKAEERNSWEDEIRNKSGEYREAKNGHTLCWTHEYPTPDSNKSEISCLDCDKTLYYSESNGKIDYSPPDRVDENAIKEHM